MKKRGDTKRGGVLPADIGGVSVVIPSYNAADWLPTTTDKLQDALLAAGLDKKNAEIVIVDDGSSDTTSEVVAGLAKKSLIPINYIHQKNSGRYIARKNGVLKARFAYVWFVDTRVYVAKNSLKFVYSEMQKSGDNTVWNAHVNAQKKGNIIARFMDAITYIGWRRYFKQPRRVAYSLEDFDHYPKGTTSFLAPKKVLMSAMQEFEQEDRGDIKYSSDDTHLIRIIARDHPINLSPEFSCVYHARTTLKGFVLQAFYRGQTFVDGFLRPNTRFFIPLIFFLIATPITLIGIILNPVLSIGLIGLWLLELVVALYLGVLLPDALSLFILSPVFAIMYGAGIWRGFYRKLSTVGFGGKNALRLKKLLAMVYRHKIALTVLLVMLVLHFWGVFLHINTALYGGPGDHTAGIIWLYDQYSQSPWWHSTALSAYPYGDKLWSPLFSLGQIGYVVFWVCAKVMGSPVGGYNLFTSIAFIGSFFVAYGFIIKRFLRAKFIAALLAALVTFTPMALFLDAVGHTSYLFMPAYLFGVVWCVLRMFETKVRTPAIILGVLGGLTVLFDPYFVLFIPLAAVSFASALLILRYYKKFHITIGQVLARMGQAVLVSLVFIVPTLLYIQLNSHEVAEITANSRSDQVLDATLYSARVEDYILPSAQNPFSPTVVKQLKSSTFHGSDATFTLYLGWTLIAAVVGALIWWLKHPKPKSKQAAILRTIGIAALVTSVVAFIFSLPPEVKIGSMTIHTPAWYLASIAPIWRVFARFYFIVQPMMVLTCIAWFCEYIMAMPLRGGRRVSYSACIAIGFILLFEYLPRNPLDVGAFWSYDRDLPTVYDKVSQEKQQVIAEYPMREQPYYKASLYLTGQHLHSSPTINAYSPTSPTAYNRIAIMDLNNPQTIPALRYIGATTLIVWNTDRQYWSPLRVDGLKKVYSENYASKFEKSKQKIERYMVESGIEYRYVAVLQSPYRPSDEGRLYDIEVPLQSGLSVAVVDLCQGMKKTCPDARDSFKLQMTVGNNTEGDIDVVLRSAMTDDQKKITLHKGKNAIDINMKTNRYVFKFDKKFNDLITISNQRIVQ